MHCNCSSNRRKVSAGKTILSITSHLLQVVNSVKAGCLHFVGSIAVHKYAYYAVINAYIIYDYYDPQNKRYMLPHISAHIIGA